LCGWASIKPIFWVMEGKPNGRFQEYGAPAYRNPRARLGGVAHVRPIGGVDTLTLFHRFTAEEPNMRSMERQGRRFGLDGF